MRDGESLHHFDMELCTHLCGNLAQILDHPSVAGAPDSTAGFDAGNHLRLQLPFQLRRHVEGVRRLVHPRHALDGNEILLIEWALRALPEELGIEFRPHPLLFSKWRDTLEDVLVGSDAVAAGNWKTLCTDFEANLATLGKEPVHEGVNNLVLWIDAVRDQLLASDRLHLVPLALGVEPADQPRHYRSLSAGDPEMASCLGEMRNPPEKVLDALPLLRAAIHELGPEAKSAMILERAGGRKQTNLTALRHLAYLGEYAGFQHARKTPLSTRTAGESGTDRRCGEVD